MNELADILSAPVVRLGDGAVLTTGALLAAMVVFVLLLLPALAALSWRSVRRQAGAAAEAAERARRADEQMAALTRAQAELHGRMGTLAEIFSTRQSELNRAIGERLDGMSSRLGHSISEQTKATHENLARLQERLAVIDTAQNNIQSLAGQVVQLQHILADKQTRGAFGQSRMEAIIADGLPSTAYAFQATLSNNSRPDCLVRMPNGAPSLVIDAKFPLESWNAIRAAGEGEAGAEAVRQAQQNFRRDVEVHIRAIAEKYLISGETQDTAFMFVPSESIFAEIHENFEALVQKAYRANVVIVSPSLLMLSIQVIQAVLKDARMREQAHLIQREVTMLMQDVGRLDERVRKLQSHFQQASRDVEMILTSAGKVTKRGEKIEALELGVADTETGEGKDSLPAQDDAAADAKDAAMRPGGNRLRLRVVDEE